MTQSKDTGNKKEPDKKVACIIKRDFWSTDGVRHRKGRGYEATPEEAMDGIENGSLERVK